MAVRIMFMIRLKVNKTIDADNSGLDLCPCLWDDVVSQQDVSTPFNILFEATEYWDSIRIFEDIRFEWYFIFIPSF